MSDNESICIPNLFSLTDLSFFVLATFPSNASHRPENIRKNTPRYGCPDPFNEISIPSPADIADKYVKNSV